MNPIIKFIYVDESKNIKLFGIFDKNEKEIIPYEYDDIKLLVSRSNKKKCYFKVCKKESCKIISIERINSHLEIKEELLPEIKNSIKN